MVYQYGSLTSVVCSKQGIIFGLFSADEAHFGEVWMVWVIVRSLVCTAMDLLLVLIYLHCCSIFMI